MSDRPLQPGRKPPPQKTRLYWSSLTSSEKSVLDAMYEHNSNGDIVWASLKRLAAYCKLSRKTVQRVLRGDERKKPMVGLIKRGIVTQLAPANCGKNRPASYRINPEALPGDPEMERYRRRQGVLPGVQRMAIPREPIERPMTDPQAADFDEQPTDPRSIVEPLTYGPTVHSPTDPRSTNSLDLDSLIKSKAIHHAEGAMTMTPLTSPASKPTLRPDDVTLNALPPFLALKEQLRGEMSSEEWGLWVRPMLLLKVMPVDGERKHFLAALPPNSRIQNAALKRVPMMRELLAPAGLNISLTNYPDEYEISEAKKRYDIDMAPQPWTRES
jgi:hypothetical protein